MRKVLTIVLLVVLVLSLVLPVAAQDDSMDGMITCDSTLITLLLVAETDYGFHSMMDVSQFDKGQYEPLFESMMTMMDDESMDEDMADDEMMDDESMDEDMADDEMMDDEMMTLSPGVIEGEPTECTDLRTEIESYLYDHFSMTLMADDDM
jgi:hypothetical protein